MDNNNNKIGRDKKMLILKNPLILLELFKYELLITFTDKTVPNIIRSKIMNQLIILLAGVLTGINNK